MLVIIPFILFLDSWAFGVGGLVIGGWGIDQF